MRGLNQSRFFFFKWTNDHKLRGIHTEGNCLLISNDIVNRRANTATDMSQTGRNLILIIEEIWIWIFHHFLHVHQDFFCIINPFCTQTQQTTVTTRFVVSLLIYWDVDSLLSDKYIRFWHKAKQWSIEFVVRLPSSYKMLRTRGGITPINGGIKDE